MRPGGRDLGCKGRALNIWASWPPGALWPTPPAAHHTLKQHGALTKQKPTGAAMTFGMLSLQHCNLKEISFKSITQSQKNFKRKLLQLYSFFKKVIYF